MKFQRALLASLLVMAGCSGTNQDSNKIAKLVSGNYFSMRQQTPADYIGIIQLSSPALLSNAKNQNGKIVLDEELKDQILTEHLNAVNQLKRISKDIQIIGEYKMVLNAIAFVAPSGVEKEILQIEGVGRLLENSNFERPANVNQEVQIKAALKKLEERNSVNFIGANKVHAEGINGTNMRVGIIDTGVDYTHVMMGGPGSSEIYKSIDPALPNQYFPNDKVIGGVDFVGSDFAPSSTEFAKTIPRRDANPIDESGHGTHVAGSVAGIGDGEFSYNGVAPDAKIYALKVFGKEGGTSDIAVIQALEYAADPSESLDPSNRLDVVNLSLGASYGKPKVLYVEAVSNLVKAGTVVVASAGNSGDTPYITGAPATSEDAISVAASIDNMLHNIEAPASTISINGEETLVERSAADSAIDPSSSSVSGGLVYLGNTVDPISEAAKSQVKGKIALVDRGINGFVEKFKVATELGAIGVVVANNAEGENIKMGGEGKFDIPAAMISKASGKKIKDALTSGSEVVFQFNSGKMIERLDLVDTITNFSSRGPRSMDSLIKPEISGPGYNVISAENGSGNKYVQMSGTSMSGPHLAGAMALLKEANPKDSVAVLKAKLLNTAKILKDKEGKYVDVARQGAGRVQIDRAYSTKAYAIPATLSLGEVPVAGVKRVAKKVTITNTSDSDMVFSTRALFSKNIKVNVAAGFKVKAKSTYVLNASFELQREDKNQNNIEADGFIILTNNQTGETLNLPFLAVLNKVSDIKSSNLITHTNSKADKVGVESTITLINKSASSGDAMIFNLLGKDGKKVVIDTKRASSDSTCDLEAAGIRVVEREENGETLKMLQFGVKLYDSLTDWSPCDVSVQFDNNNDGVADQELVGILSSYISGMGPSVFSSLLFDANIARNIRLNYEGNKAGIEESYLPALQAARPMYFYNHSNVAMVEVELSKILKDKKDTVGIKLALMHLEGNNDYDDFLGDHDKKWQRVNLSEEGLAFYEIPDTVTVNGFDQTTVSMRRGKGEGELLVLYPHNTPAALKDKQSQILVEQLLK